MSVAGTDSPVYLVPSSAGVYSSADFPLPAPTVMTMRHAPQANQGQTYYGMQRMVNPPDQFYREQQPVLGRLGLMPRVLQAVLVSGLSEIES
ncbi:hypothetical protein Tco_1028798 [Tanacetum coccineum]|uniref:Uncharacterized protein n=1 Tax=Tanacetum coccineum TaxID=301880 RepID=A0ABQ5G1N6_9ASTR